MRRAFCVFCLTALLIVFSRPGRAQDGPNPDPLLRIDARFVWVPAWAETADRRPIQNPGISQARLWDNGIEQKLSLLKTDDLPVSLVVLLQTGGSANQYLSIYEDLPALLRNIVAGSVHEITLVTFDSHIEEIWHFPARSDGVDFALTHQPGGDQGASIRDAIAFGVNQLQAEPGRFRRIILLVSGDSDRGSSIASQPLLEKLGSASTVVYSLTFRDRTQAPKPPSNHGPSGKSDAATRALDAALRALDTHTADEAASLTGGCAFHFTDQRSFNSGLLGIADRFRDGYTFGFEPAPNVSGFHDLKVESVSSGLRITARKAYWSGAGQ